VSLVKPPCPARRTVRRPTILLALCGEGHHGRDMALDIFYVDPDEADAESDLIAGLLQILCSALRVILAANAPGRVARVRRSLVFMFHLPIATVWRNGRLGSLVRVMQKSSFGHTSRSITETKCPLYIVCFPQNLITQTGS
jgi:hypothetical protein